MGGELLLLLDRRELLVSLEGRALRVERPDAGPQRVPLGAVGLVVVQGAPVVACDVWRALAERGIPAVLVAGRGTETAVWLGPGLSNSIDLRRRQHRADTALGLVIARRLVALKIHSQRRLVAGLSGGPFRPAGVVELVQTLTRRLDDVEQAADVAALMGLEGAAAAAWYGWLAQHLPAHWQFSGRNRRPPRDPVNALLSLGYTLVGAEVATAVQEVGLDPALGFLHGVMPGRESLVLDVLEPLRAGVDAVVLGLLDEVLLPGHFSDSAGEGCRLNKDGRGLFYTRWAEARLRWPLPLAAEVGLDMDDDGPEETLDGRETVGDVSLRAQCRRVVRCVRTLLRRG